MSDTPLLREIRALVESEGPISVARYMQLCLGHPRHGYYMTRDPFGSAGDFVTAPEVSQMFGELVGLWCADTWTRLGSPGRVALVELGPGRGTLMADALRAARVMPAFRSALEVHLVETSPVLRDAQRRTLESSGCAPTWHDTLLSLPTDVPLLVIANEFFDALPVRQWQSAGSAWYERLVGLSADGHLAFGLAPEEDPAMAGAPPAPEGTVVEVSDVSAVLMAQVAARLARQGGTALVVDYGHLRSGPGDTLQALQAHRPVDPLSDPGDADLTVHVDFEALARHARSAGAAVFPPLEQASFLLALGIESRAAALFRAADAAGRAAVEAALARLVGRSPADMGALFKVLAVAHPSVQELAAFGPPLAPLSPGATP